MWTYLSFQGLGELLIKSLKSSFCINFSKCVCIKGFSPSLGDTDLGRGDTGVEKLSKQRLVFIEWWDGQEAPDHTTVSVRPVVSCEKRYSDKTETGRETERRGESSGQVSENALVLKDSDFLFVEILKDNQLKCLTRRIKISRSLSS